MGLGKHGVGGAGPTFVKDVLKLEISGPDQDHLSVVDVPGIFRKTTEGVTTKADKELLDSIVQQYMKNPRSIMLTVVPANVDIATQEILTMAEDVNQDGHRTLGVLTKPDLVDKGAEENVMELLRGERHKLRLGWCIVRNLGQNQLQKNTTDRNSLENYLF
jgi:GTP-binding protein EngB required for normal cell division